MIEFGSVCSGIEAASVAWHPLGWKAAWLAEIEPFPSALLAHHYPNTPNLGDMTLLPDMIDEGLVAAPPVFCGGTPCQAFSVAGLRKSLDDARGNLSLTFCEIANAIDRQRADHGKQPAIIFWENVPGVLSTKDNAFGCFLAGLAGEDQPLVPSGDKWTDAGVVLGPQRAVAWRTLDAQYFGVAQRRKRVFVVASARDDIDPVEILLEFSGVRRDSAPSREARQDVANCLTDRPDRGGAGGRPEGAAGNHFIAEVAEPLLATDYKGLGHNRDHNFVAHSLRGEGFDTSEDGASNGGVGHGARSGDSKDEYIVLVAFHPTQDPISSEDGSTHAMGTGSKGGCATVAVAFSCKDHGAYIGGIDNENNGFDVEGACGPLMKGSPTGGGWPLPVVAFADTYNGTITGDVATTLSTMGGAGKSGPSLLQAMQVRRLTPTECERLQGFPDGYTDIMPKGKPTPDGPRYKALGNSWAVPNVRWIGRRIHNHLFGGIVE